MVRVKERVAPRAPENADDEQRFPQIQGSRRFRNPSVASLNLWEHWLLRVPARPPFLMGAAVGQQALWETLIEPRMDRNQHE